MFVFMNNPFGGIISMLCVDLRQNKDANTNCTETKIIGEPTLLAAERGKNGFKVQLLRRQTATGT